MAPSVAQPSRHLGRRWTRVREEFGCHYDQDAVQEAGFEIVFIYNMEYIGDNECRRMDAMNMEQERLRAATGAKQGPLNFAILIIKSHFRVFDKVFPSRFPPSVSAETA